MLRDFSFKHKELQHYFYSILFYSILHLLPYLEFKKCTDFILMPIRFDRLRKIKNSLSLSPRSAVETRLKELINKKLTPFEEPLPIIYR